MDNTWGNVKKKGAPPPKALFSLLFPHLNQPPIADITVSTVYDLHLSLYDLTNFMEPLPPRVVSSKFAFWNNFLGQQCTVKRK